MGLMDVIQITADCHKEQKYGEHEYLYHINSVVDKCVSMYKSYVYDGESILTDHWLTVAYLHDSLEDNPDFYNTNIYPHLNEREKHSIDCISKRKSETRGKYLKRCMTDKVAHFVKICDTMCNLEESVKIYDSRRVITYTSQLSELVLSWEELYKWKHTL